MSEKCCCGGDDRDAIRNSVKKKYGEIASQASKRKSCCDVKADTDPITQDLYSVDEASELPEEAILASMGCGNPVALAELNPGETVLDLGSGGGIDVLLSARRVGPTGKAYGLDMTDEMLALAEQNKAKSGVTNVEFLKGEIENVPLPDESVDVIISNCVINLSTDKDKVLAEAYRVLKPGGRFAVADIVFTRPVFGLIKDYVALWAGCISGALTIEDYKRMLREAGFADADVEIIKTYSASDAEALIPADVRRKLTPDKLEQLITSFVSAFVRAVKPQSGGS